MHRLTIQYAVPADPEAFDAHYFDKHIPLVGPLPGLRAFTWSKPRPLGGEQTVYLVAQLDFDDAEAMTAALKSPQMAVASKDAAGLGVPTVMFSGEVVTA